MLERCLTCKHYRGRFKGEFRWCEKSKQYKRDMDEACEMWEPWMVERDKKVKKN